MHQTKLLFFVPIAATGSLPAPSTPAPATGRKRRKRQTQTEAEVLMQNLFCNAAVLALVMDNMCKVKVSQMREVPGVSGSFIDYHIIFQAIGNTDAQELAVTNALKTANENIETNSNGVFTMGTLSGKYYFPLGKKWLASEVGALIQGTEAGGRCFRMGVL